MARRAASICRLVIQAGSSVIRPYSPKAMVVPPLATPLIRPRMTLRCLTRRGISMLGAPCRSCGLARQLPLGHDVAAVDPDLDTDGAVCRACQDLAVADVGAQRAKRHAALLLPLAAGHLGPAQATGDVDLHAPGPGLH